MLKMGIDYEFFIVVDGKVARARNLTRYVDGNCSTAEYRTNVIKYVDDFLSDIRRGLSVVASDVISNIPLLTIPSVKFLFTPVVKVPVYYSNYDLEVLIYKTAGIHFHRSDLPANSGRHSYISRLFNEISHEAARRKPEILERIEALVPGPSSGTIYNYGSNGNIWRPKSGKDYYEFIAPPSSSLLFNQEAIEAMFRLLLKGNIENDNDRAVIIESIAHDAEINLIDFVKDSKCDIFISKLDRQYKIDEFPTSYDARDTIDSWFSYVNFVIIPEVEDAKLLEIEKHKFYSVWKKHTIGVMESDLPKAIKALHNKDFDWLFGHCFTRMDRVYDTKFFNHLAPPIDFLSAVKENSHYKPYYEKWRKSTQKTRRTKGEEDIRRMKKVLERKSSKQEGLSPTSSTTNKYVTDYFYKGPTESGYFVDNFKKIKEE